MYIYFYFFIFTIFSFFHKKYRKLNEALPPISMIPASTSSYLNIAALGT
jgi:hypothetical protein